MHTALVLTGAVLFPIGTMVALLWLDHLEDGLDASLETLDHPAPATLRVVPVPEASTVRSLPVRNVEHRDWHAVS